MRVSGEIGRVPGALSLRDETAAQRRRNGRGSIVDAQLHQDVADVRPYRRFADAECGGNVLVRAAGHQSPQHVQLPVGQVGGRAMVEFLGHLFRDHATSRMDILQRSQDLGRRRTLEKVSARSGFERSVNEFAAG